MRMIDATFDEIKGIYARHISIFEQYVEKHKITNVHRRKGFLLRCLRDIDSQFAVLKRKNNTNKNYLEKIMILKRFLVDTSINLAAQLKCLDYVDFCTSDENRQQLTYTKHEVKEIEHSGKTTTLYQPLPVMTSNMNELQNYVKDNVRLINDCNIIFDTFERDDKLNVFYGHINIMNNLIYNIDSYVFNKILMYCNNKEPDKVWNKTIPSNIPGLPPISIKEHYLTLRDLLTELDMKTYEETAKHTANYILVDSRDSIILQMLDDFEATTSSSSGCAINIGKYHNKDICVLAQMNQNKIILGNHYSCDQYCESDIVFQFEHIFRLPDVDDFDKPLYMDATTEILTDNLKVIEIVE